jgi:hypothetical protein
MPTALELAQQREADKLRRSGLNPDGTPMQQTQPNARDDEDDQDDDDQDDDPAPNRMTAEQQEIADLRRQLAMMQGRVAPAQQGQEEYRQLWEGERQARVNTEAQLRAQLDALQAQIDASKPGLQLDQILTPEEIQDIDPLVLAAMTKVATAVAKTAAPKVDVKTATMQVLAEREAEKVVQHRTKVMSDPTRGLHQLAQLAYDQDFIAWSREDDNDVDSVITSLLKATSTEEVDRYAKIVAKRITKFRERNSDRQPPDTRTALGSHMRRDVNAKKTAAEVTALVNKAKSLARSPRAEDRAEAKRILDSLN